MNNDYYVVLCTCPTAQIANQLAKQLIIDKLAACVNVLPNLVSHYSWQGQLTSDAECLLIIKTTKDNYENLEHAIKTQHPYECPEIIALPIAQGAQNYLSWITQQIDNLT